MNNKTIMITGANGAIGSLIVKEYLDRGYVVFALVHKDLRRIELLRKEYGEQLICRKCDLTNLTEVDSLFAELFKSYGYIPNKMIHTSAVRSSDSKILTETDPKLWYSIIEMNIFACYNLLRNLLVHYQQSGGGKIVLIGSNISRTGLKNGSAYAVAKGALTNFVRTIALEYGEDDIMINLVSPGAVNADQSHFSKEYQEFRAGYFKRELQNTPLKRLVEPLDVFHTCDFLLSDNNRSITGEEIFLTGGKL